MKKVFSFINRVPKHMWGVVAVLAAAIAIPASLLAWGPNRPTYTMESPADHVTFDSITNNPDYGDERNFVTIKDASNTNAGGWTDSINVENGKEYYVRMYVHNNAASNLNLVATNTTARFNVPTYSAQRIQIDGYLSADNANPQTVWDQAVFTSNSNFNLAYESGSATYTNNVFTGGTGLSDSVVSSGALLGYTKLDGNVPGCMQYTGFVIFKVKAVTSDFTIDKTVRINGTSDKTFKENITANAGNTVDYQIYFKNTGGTQLKDVVIQDSLPAGITYIAGSTSLHNSDGTKQVADGITAGGIVIGGYMPDGDAYIKFSAKIADSSKLNCGNNSLVNTVKATTSAGSKTDPATVTVTKTCPNTPVTPANTNPTTLPQTGAEDILKLIGAGAITAGIAYYVTSRRKLL